MSFAAVEEIARAVLYEGYLLYPYRTSALKNRQRWMFGRLVPQEYSLAHGELEPWSMQTECLVAGAPQTELEISVRFLQLMAGDDGNGGLGDAVERKVGAVVGLEQIAQCPYRIAFAFEPRLEGAISLVAVDAGSGLVKVTVVIENQTPSVAEEDLDGALFSTLISTHTILRVQEGEFISLLDPPESCRELALNCRNIGAWPVLVGQEPGKMMLSAPIILYDYPQVAPESPGDLFDGTEIDELLSLRILTLTSDEKRQMAAASEHARRILERTQALTEEQLLRMHGRLQSGTALQPAPRSQSSQAARSEECPFQPGDRVRLRPHRGADALDVLLSGQLAAIVAIERDFENRVHLAVVIDDDPGRDLGVRGHPAHRFFFGPEEVERV